MEQNEENTQQRLSKVEAEVDRLRADHDRLQADNHDLRATLQMLLACRENDGVAVATAASTMNLPPPSTKPAPFRSPEQRKKDMEKDKELSDKYLDSLRRDAENRERIFRKYRPRDHDGGDKPDPREDIDLSPASEEISTCEAVPYPPEDIDLSPAEEDISACEAVVLQTPNQVVLRPVARHSTVMNLPKTSRP